jgi:short subunit fatty acids transporter
MPDAVSAAPENTHPDALPREGYLVRLAVAFTAWAERWFPDAFIFRSNFNPFWMLPLLGVLGLRARDLVGFTFLQLLVHLPVVLFLLWALAYTLEYHPPVIP